MDHDAAEKPGGNEEKSGANAAADLETAWVTRRKNGGKPKRNGQSRTSDKPENESAV